MHHFIPVVHLRVCSALHGHRTAGEAGSTRVAILPFAMNTPASINYLQSGLRDMLSSRLLRQGKVEVVDKSEIDSAAKGTKEISQNEALRIGAALKADYVLVRGHNQHRPVRKHRRQNGAGFGQNGAGLLLCSSEGPRRRHAPSGPVRPADKSKNFRQTRGKDAERIG